MVSQEKFSFNEPRKPAATIMEPMPAAEVNRNLLMSYSQIEEEVVQYDLQDSDSDSGEDAINDIEEHFLMTETEEQ